MKPREIIKLKGITGHGKNRIREHGEDWLVLSDKDIGVISRSQKPQFPPIRSLATNEWRWLDNRNFEVIK